LANIKSCNYLENLLIFDEAKKRGFDEAIRLNEEGKIASATMANIFWVNDEKIFTPSHKTGCLAGTMREFLLENFEIFEVEAELNEVIKADEIFLTSSGIGIQPAFFENPERQNFPKTQSIQSAFYDARLKF
jgi:branched-subunit amino acid aminotransferase/4-amino-4-deoxychorismate lyase